MNDIKYTILIKILDGIRNEAPMLEEYKRFHSKIPEDITYSRGQAFIHLFLLVKFGIDTFIERDKLICDGPGDGGLDAYYISQTQKTVYLLQSKFKNSDSGFISESVSASDLVRMELDRILKGEIQDNHGNQYNAKILEFQNTLKEMTRKQILSQQVVFLANLKNLYDFHIRKLTNELDYDVYDYERCYLELVKPLCSGTYFNAESIVIELDLVEKSNPQLKQTVVTSYGTCDITAVFIPTIEIGQVMSRYKNAILRYNPRNYLGLSKNKVNKDIRRSIVSSSCNDFALLNNGITILADEQEYTQYTGTKNVGRLVLKNPQIINGGQTAYTLSDIYEKEFVSDHEIFKGKEVLVRIVVLKGIEVQPIGVKLNFINAVSTSTNSQTQVTDADRLSSAEIFVNVQEEVFRKYGVLIELKQGEFYHGIHKGFIHENQIMKRVTMLRTLVAFLGQPVHARRYAESNLFNSNFIDNLFGMLTDDDISAIAAKVYYAYQTHNHLVYLRYSPLSRPLHG